MSDASDAVMSSRATAAIRAEAAEWLVRLAAPDVMHADHVAFVAWLRRSPVHMKEYLHAEATWSAMSDAAHLDTSDVQALLREVAPNVVPLPYAARASEVGESAQPEPQVAKEAVTSRSRISRARVASLAAAVAAMGVGLFLFGPELIERLRTETYTTGIGEQRRIMLPDGSAIELNTRSEVDVLYSDAARDVMLRRGEALFSVSKDAARPFRVHSDTAVVRAVGTQFNVYRRADETIVTVLEGRVAIERSAGETEASSISNVALEQVSVELTAGDVAQIPVQPDAQVVAAKASTERAVAWRQRRLIFDDAPLAEVVAEFNRYNAQQIVIENPTIAGERISGVFDADSPEALVRFITRGSEVCYRTIANRGSLGYCQ